MECRPLRSLGRGDLDSWRALADAAIEPNPFFDPDFVMPASGALAGSADVHLARVVDRGETVAAFPAVRHRWRGALPAVSSWRHMYCFLGTPLVHASRDPAEVLRPLVEGLSTGVGRRSLVWEQVVTDGPVARGLRQVAAELDWQTALEMPVERAFTPLREDDAYLDHLSRKRRKEHGRLRRRLTEAVEGELTTRDTTAEADAPDRFLRVEASGWKGAEGTALQSDPADAAMFREICDGFRARGKLQLLELGTDRRTIAVKCNLLSGDGAFAFKIGYDETLAQYSPGVQLEIDNLRQLRGTGASWMDSCAAEDNSMINQLWPGRRRLSSLLFTRDDALGSATGVALRAAARLHQRRKRIRA